MMRQATNLIIYETVLAFTFSVEGAFSYASSLQSETEEMKQTVPWMWPSMISVSNAVSTSLFTLLTNFQRSEEGAHKEGVIYTQEDQDLARRVEAAPEARESIIANYNKRKAQESGVLTSELEELLAQRLIQTAEAGHQDEEDDGDQIIFQQLLPSLPVAEPPFPEENNPFKEGWPYTYIPYTCN